MSQPALDFTAPPQGPSLVLLTGKSMCAKLARFLLAHRGEWIDGMVLAKHGGKYAYRTRISELRHAPWFLNIENRKRKVIGDDFEAFTISEYRLHD